MEQKKTLFRILSHSAKETESAGILLASQLKGDEFVAMYGDLGAGKTAFVRGVASVIAPMYDVSSPTYTIVNEYGEGKGRLCHFDMYRIDSEDDLESIGFYDYTDCILIAEWSENIPYALPKSYYSVPIEKLSENERIITLEFVEAVK
ncbi:MAG: tRNA (adenosine(37)-N6)-threonylcarbamoyltransferase complex ATPase subunit type 1 TsaE [Clostridia bacterium]|nr:tRNA (adenosine(37)-N6)-threonylcarbamoyltransferase complex ATPase subunit type 1 TsaE [Clostridia bacterium]